MIRKKHIRLRSVLIVGKSMKRKGKLFIYIKFEMYLFKNMKNIGKSFIFILIYIQYILLIFYIIFLFLFNINMYYSSSSSFLIELPNKSDVYLSSIYCIVFLIFTPIDNKL